MYERNYNLIELRYKTFKINWKLSYNIFEYSIYSRMSDKNCSKLTEDNFYSAEKAVALMLARKLASSTVRGRYLCPKCHRCFSQSYSMYRHYRYECGDAPPRYQCPYCGHRSKWTHSIYNHVRKLHPGRDVSLNKLY